jgi:hypothetical protein
VEEKLDQFEKHRKRLTNESKMIRVGTVCLACCYVPMFISVDALFVYFLKGQHSHGRARGPEWVAH